MRIYFLIISLFLFAATLYKPLYNFDSIAFSACVTSKEIAYNDAREAFPAEEFARFTAGSPPQQNFDVVYNDAAAFISWQPFYRIRIAFTSLIYLLHCAGVNTTRAAHFLSALFCAAGFFLCYELFRKEVSGFSALLLPLGILGFGWLEVARLPVVDGMVFFFMILIAYFYMKESKAVLFLLPVLIAIRIDLALFTGLVYGAYWFNKKWRKEVALSGAVSLIIYLFVYFALGAYPFEKVFYFVLIEKYPRMDLIKIESLNYFHIAFEKYQNIFKNPPLLFYLLLSLLTFHSGNSGRTYLERFSIIGFIYTIVHLLILPAVYNRYFLGFYIITLIVFLKKFRFLTLRSEIIC